MALRHYVETIETWQNPSLDTDNQWLEYDLSQYGVPPNAVAEIVIGNIHFVNAYRGGVRATSSSLNRYIFINKSQNDNATVTMRVQVDNNSKIEYFSQYATAINFNLIGYWVGCEYTEAIEEFDPSSQGVWQNKTLSGYGVSAGEVVDIILANHFQSYTREMSVREVGSSRTKLFRISRADGISFGGNNCFSTLVTATGANATIQVYTQSKFSTRMFFLGHFTTPPGDFVETTQFFGAPDDNRTWEDLDVGASGIVGGSVAYFPISIGHNYNTIAGVRQTTSTLDRHLSIDFPPDSIGRIYTSMHVNVDSSGHIQRYGINLFTPDNPSFECLGYWTNFTNSIEPFVSNHAATLFIEGLNTNIHYIENYTNNNLSHSTDGSWQSVDVSSENYPNNAVAEIISQNRRSDLSMYVGIRTDDSSLERKTYLRSGYPGHDMLTWHVKIQDNKQVEILAGGNVTKFYGVGYWIGSEYVELYDTFKATAQSGWVNHDLDQYGVPSGKIAEIVVLSADEDAPQSGGVRQIGSTIDRVIEINGLIGIQGSPHGFDALSMFVNTSGSNSSIQVYVGNSGLMDFVVVGYWNIAPGNFTELITTIDPPATSGAWKQIDLFNNYSIPIDAVAHICMGNTGYNDLYNILGVREIEKTSQAESEARTTPNRRFRLRQTSIVGSGMWGVDVVTAHVNTTNGLAEFITHLPSGSSRFWALGYWDDFRLSVTPVSGTIPLYIDGAELSTQILTSGDLFIHGHQSTDTSCSLHICGRETSCIYSPNNVVFYHPADDYIENTIQLPWDEDTVVFDDGILTSGLTVTGDGESWLSYDNSTGCYPKLGGVSSFAIAFWSKNFYKLGQSAFLFVGNSDSPTSLVDENGVHIHGTARRPMIHIDGSSSIAIGSLNVPLDDAWHFTVIYAEISGSNWKIYGSVDGDELDLLTNTVTSDAMTDRQYFVIHLEDATPPGVEPIIDEIICWSGLSAPISHNDIISLHRLGSFYHETMNNFCTHTMWHGDIELFMRGQGETSVSSYLYIEGCETTNNSCNLFIDGLDVSTISVSLYINSHEETNNSTSLLIAGHNSVATSGDLFIEGHELTNESTDLYIRGLAVVSGVCDLFINGDTDFVLGVDLYIYGREISVDSTDLFIEGHSIADTSRNLFINGYDSTSTSCDLFIHGDTDSVLGADLYINGHDVDNDTIDLFIQGFASTTTSGTLCITGHVNTNNSAILFILGHDVSITLCSLFINGHIEASISGDLYIGGHESTNDAAELFILGREIATTSSDLFIHGFSPSVASGDLYINGHIVTTAFTTLFIRGSGIIAISDSISLIINGLEPKPSTSCPTLDTTAVIQIPAALIKTYQGIIDGMVNQLGKNTLLEFDPILEKCPNCEFDTLRKRSTGVYKIGGPRPFTRGRQCPWCKSAGLLNIPVTQCIKCLTEWNSQDVVRYGISVEKTKNIAKLKTYITDADSLIRAKTALIDYDIADQMQLRAILIKGPIPLGLREDRYCISFWELI